MESREIILGMFYSDYNNLIHDSIKYSEDFSQEIKEQIRMLPFKFLGPVFLTSSSVEGNNWKIDLIESSLSMHHETKMRDMEIMIQSFINLNSSLIFEDGVTNLFALIASPHTEDIKPIYDKMTQYIHPSINQGIMINKRRLGRKFKEARFIREELNRGINLVDYYLGSSRKMYWEEEQKYYCIGVIERKVSGDLKTSNLYTFDKDDLLRRIHVHSIPSFYVMAIIPVFYENLVFETLKIFGRKNLLSNIRQINLSNEQKKIVYYEEFIIDKGEKTSLGVILIQNDDNQGESHNISHYKKHLRQILDQNIDFGENLMKINPHFSLAKWSTSNEEDLNNIHAYLDKAEN